MYYCIECKRIHEIVEPTAIVFSTGYHFVNQNKVHVGVCQKKEAAVRSEASLPAEEKTGLRAPIAS